MRGGAAEGAGWEVRGWLWWSYCVVLGGGAGAGSGWVGRGRERGEPWRGLRIGGLDAVGGRVGRRERERACGPAVRGSGVRHFPFNPVMVGGDRVRGRGCSVVERR